MIDTIYLECNLACLTSIRESNEDYLIVAKNPSALGQGFRGIDIDGAALPLGGTFLEFPRLEDTAINLDISNYSTNTLNGITQFSPILHNYLSSFSELQKLNGYTSQLHGESFNDFVLGDSLQILNMFDSSKIKKQISHLPLTDPSHPRNKHAFNPTTEMSYEIYCRDLYGDYLYDELLKPLKEKIIGHHDINCLKYHRANWLPLYWPDSILKYLETGDDLTPYHFYRFAKFNFAEWTRRMCDSIDQNRIVSGEVQNVMRNGNIFTVLLNDGRQLQCRRVVSALNAEQLNQLLCFTPRSYDRGNSIYLAYLRKDLVTMGASPEAQFILDPENAIYRISSYATHVSIELSSMHLNALNEDQRASRVISDFIAVTGAKLDKNALAYLREFSNARVKLTTNNYLYHQELLQANENLGIELTGSASGFGVGSIADQLIQGMQLASYRPDMAMAENFAHT